MANKITRETPVEELFMVGSAYAKRLEKLEIETAGDLLYHFPFRYDNYSRVVSINQAQTGETVTVSGQVKKIQNRFTKFKKRRITTAVIEDKTGQIETIWFNQLYLTKAIKVGDRINLSGEIKAQGNRKKLVSPDWEIIKPQGRPCIHTGCLVPIYPETARVSSKWLRSRIFPVLKPLIDQEKDWLPGPIKEKEDLIDLKTALKQIHFPKDKESIKKARKRLGFNELFLLQLAALKKRQDWQKQKINYSLSVNDYQKEINHFYQSLPFQLTNAQKRAVKEILQDLGKKAPMNRLLEGDVGSGKTIVATVAIYLTFLNGCQSALMAPTEILAHQHFLTLNQFLSPLGVKVGLQTGSRKDLKKKKDFDLIVGTHALLSDQTNFQKLALVVVDEQHRFGVIQRAELKKKALSGKRGNKSPHFLTMTATPIPRTVTLTLYGDLDLSLIDEMPKGRKEIQTWVVSPKKRFAAYEWVAKEITRENSQAFIICPLIEESEHETMKNVRAVTAEYEKLEKIFPHLRLGLLHGRLKAKEKERVLEEFKKEKTKILVATPVVEVGIDIPNATIIVVEGADRFGLAQLHQLRGRVGRGKKKSYCLLFSSSRSAKVYQRLKQMEKVHLGHQLAEIDLKMRGPGQVFGTAQHGFLDLKIASLSDLDLTKRTRTAVQAILKKSPDLKRYPPLQEKFKRLKIAKVEAN